MKTTMSLRNFERTKRKIEELNKNESRFRQIYHEYKLFRTQLWNVQSGLVPEEVADDFIDALQIQISYLENEIEEWLNF